MERKFGYRTNGAKQAKEGCRTCFGKTVRPVGYEREVKGYIIVKTALYPTKPSSKDNWKLKHQWIWEQTHNAKLPKGWVVRFKDGNTRNFEPSNLDALPRGLNQMINDNVSKLGMKIKTAEDYDAIKSYVMLKKKFIKKGKRKMKYKTIPNTGRKYCAGEDGHIYRMHDLHRIAERPFRNQYCACNLFHNGVSSTFCVHKLVALAWCDDFDNGKHIHHINRNTKDNRPSNLQCLTPLEHMTLHYGELPEWRAEMLEIEYKKNKTTPQDLFPREKRKKQLEGKKKYRQKAKSKEGKCLLMSNKIKRQIQMALQLEKQTRKNY